MPAVGRIGAIVGASRNRAKQRTEQQNRRKKAQLTARERARAQARAKRAKRLNDIMKQFDTDHSGNLNKEQLRQVMQQMSKNRQKETGQTQSEVTDEEVEWLLCRGDESGTHAIERDELFRTILWWDDYIQQREELMKALDEFDTSRTGSLNVKEMQRLLQRWQLELDPECDEPVPLDDVKALVEACDESGTGELNAPELCFAAHVYFGTLNTIVDAPGNEGGLPERKSSVAGAGGQKPAAKEKKDQGCSCTIS